MTLQHLGRVLIDKFFKNGPTYEMSLESKCLNLTTFTVLSLKMTHASLKYASDTLPMSRVNIEDTS